MIPHFRQYTTTAIVRYHSDLWNAGFLNHLQSTFNIRLQSIVYFLVLFNVVSLFDTVVLLCLTQGRQCHLSINNAHSPSSVPVSPRIF